MNKELETFYKLLKEAEYKDIDGPYGPSTRWVTFVKLRDASLSISYTNIRVKYFIYYKGITIKEGELSSETEVNNEINDIIKTKRQEIIDEYNNI